MKKLFQKIKENKSFIAPWVVLGISFIIFAFGLTYAYFEFVLDSRDESILEIVATDFELTLSGSAIYVDNLAPIYDARREDQAQKFKFTISNNSRKVSACYSIYIKTTTITSELISDDMKWELVNNKGTAIASGDFSELNDDHIFLIDKRNVRARASSSFTLRLWLSNSPTKNQNYSMNATLSGKIVINAIGEDCSGGNYDEEDDNPVIAKDGTGANVPNLHANMIPVSYNEAEGDWIKADIFNNSADYAWFDYREFKWANAVTVSESRRDYYLNASPGEKILMNDILTMMVWIPRFEYKIEGQYGSGGTDYLTPGEIKVKFINGVSPTASAGYIIAPGFTFGEESLTGFWMGKFKASVLDKTSSCYLNMSEANCDVSSLELAIIPNEEAFRYIKLANAFLTARNLNTSDVYGYSPLADVHLVKNTEWAAVAYLSQSEYGKYGNPDYTGANKEVYQNKSRDRITGNSNGTPSRSTSNTQCAYNVTPCGVGASTTGTIYGVYDMVGPVTEAIMAVFLDSSGNVRVGYDESTTGFNGYVSSDTIYSEGVSLPASKYYDTYSNSNSGSYYYRTLTACNGVSVENGGCDGHAMLEIVSDPATYIGWYNDKTQFIVSVKPWMERGGYYSNNEEAGVFMSESSSLAASNNRGFRVIHK